MDITLYKLNSDMAQTKTALSVINDNLDIIRLDINNRIRKKNAPFTIISRNTNFFNVFFSIFRLQDMDITLYKLNSDMAQTKAALSVIHDNFDTIRLDINNRI